MIQEHSAGIILFNKNKDITSVLLVLHKHGNHWGFPKGHQEEGETSIETAERELAEETGVTQYALIPEVSITDVYNSQSRNKPKTKEVTYFVGVTDQKECTVPENMTHEVAETKFVPLSEAFETITHESSRTVLTAVLENELVKQALAL